LLGEKGKYKVAELPFAVTDSCYLKPSFCCEIPDRVRHDKVKKGKLSLPL
jgi:hypothetical protein